MSDKLTFTVTEAAERLGAAFSPDWLHKHLADIPHGRTGNGTGRAGRVYFTAADLDEIVAQHKVHRPEPTRVGPVSRRRAS